jgi:hypothetical protein
MPRGVGSGFIWDKAGHIVTNAHVISNATDVKVQAAVSGLWGLGWGFEVPGIAGTRPPPLRANPSAHRRPPPQVTLFDQSTYPARVRGAPGWRGRARALPRRPRRRRRAAPGRPAAARRPGGPAARRSAPAP